jgi:hypothetical protein
MEQCKHCDKPIPLTKNSNAEFWQTLIQLLEKNYRPIILDDDVRLACGDLSRSAEMRFDIEDRLARRPRRRLQYNARADGFAREENRPGQRRGSNTDAGRDISPIKLPLKVGVAPRYILTGYRGVFI